MSFSFHSDVADHPAFATLSAAAFGLWVQAGTWTSARRSLGFVPDHALAEIGQDNALTDEAAELVAAGVWTRDDGGYRMEYGPGNDFPLPVWRYDEGAPANGLMEVIPDPEP